MSEGESVQPDETVWATDSAAEMRPTQPAVPTEVPQSPPPGGEGKRRHLKSRRMIEYEKEKDRAAPQKQRVCPHPGCGKLFSSAPGLRYHVKTHSPNASHFRCDRCLREFKSHNGLKYHIQRKKCPENAAATAAIHNQLEEPIDPVRATLEEAPASVKPLHIKDVEDSENFGKGSSPLTLDEPQHRKVETRWARPRQAEEDSRSRPLTSQQQMEHSLQDQRLMQFANIATGPQSPLLQATPIDWDQHRFAAGAKAATPTPSDPQRYMECHAPTPPSPSSIVPCPLATSQIPRPELGPSDTTAVFALSTMAQQKRNQGISGKQSVPKTQNLQQGIAKSKRPMNAFMLFAKTKRLELRKKNPRTNNREISTMLSDLWKQLDPAEKKKYQELAMVTAAQQKQQNPDCWKRKK